MGHYTHRARRARIEWTRWSRERFQAALRDMLAQLLTTAPEDNEGRKGGGELRSAAPFVSSTTSDCFDTDRTNSLELVLSDQKSSMNRHRGQGKQR